MSTLASLSRNLREEDMERQSRNLLEEEMERQAKSARRKVSPFSFHFFFSQIFPFVFRFSSHRFRLRLLISSRRFRLSFHFFFSFHHYLIGLSFVLLLSSRVVLV